MNLTNRSLQLFLAYARDAGNWSGNPLIGGNVGGSKEDRGNITQLKRAGLITTSEHERGLAYISFTAEGIALAAQHGIEMALAKCERCWRSGPAQIGFKLQAWRGKRRQKVVVVASSRLIGHLVQSGFAQLARENIFRVHYGIPPNEISESAKQRRKSAAKCRKRSVEVMC